LKRSNRLVLLVGIFLAVVAFILIAVMLSGNPNTGGPKESVAPTTVKIVVAAQNIPLSATIQESDLTTKEIAIDQKPGDAFTDTSFVIGQIARIPVTSGQYISAAVVNGQGGGISNVRVPAGYVGIAVQVDQISGVGTIIKPGDFVDVISGFTGPDNVPLVIPAPVASNAPANAPTTYVKVDDTLYNHSTVKVLAQGLQVLGTLLPPPPTSDNAQATPAPTTGTGGTTVLNGQQQIVILSAPAQQAELIKFSQMSGSITLVLRSPDDCVVTQPGASPSPSASPSSAPAEPGQYCPIVATTGITLRRIVDDWGVLPPQVVQVVVPSPLPGTGRR
jgi:pilus assembly protein CpaB